MLLDVTAALLYGVSERPFFMEIPKEDPRFGGPSSDSTSCTIFVRNACCCPNSGQSTRVELLRELGYQETNGAPGVFWHPSTGVALVLHVDDFLVSGEEQALQDLKDKVQAVHELTATSIGWGEAGSGFEGNEKHVQELLRCTGMETGLHVNSPMTAEDFKDDDLEEDGGPAGGFAAEHRKTVSPRHRARSLHVAGPSGPQCSSLSAPHEDAGTN